MMARKTKADKEAIIELKKIVLEKIDLYKITAYKISKNVEDVTHPTIMNIIKGLTKYPSKEKLVKIYNYIIKEHETITETIGKKTLSVDEKLDLILESLEKISFHNKIIFEILTTENEIPKLIKAE